MQEEDPNFNDGERTPQKGFLLNLPKSSTKTTIRQQNTGI